MSPLISRRIARLSWALAGGLCAAVAGADPAAPRPLDLLEAPESGERGDAAILDPTQGRPLTLRPGEEFRFLMRLGPEVGGHVNITLRHARVPTVTPPLTAVGRLSIFQQRYASVALRLPSEMPTGTYDIVVETSTGTLEARRAVRVVDRFKTRFRFVHLSDMTVGDPSAPEFDDRLVEEVNLIAPEFIVTTGDYTAWGRILDDETSWARVLDYLAGFDAPVYMVCGDQDHQESFTHYVAQSPVGSFDYGRYHGTLLLDHRFHPLDEDQIEFLRRDLDANRDKIFNMIVLHNDDLSLLDQLAPRETLADYLRQRKVRFIITGGSDDWDRMENAAKLEGLDGVHYIRTHQASPCLRGRATGVSHYRVFEVDGDEVSWIYRDHRAEAGVEHSIPVGRLRVFEQGSGTSRVRVQVQNALNQRFDDARLWVKVARDGGDEPVVDGGRLVQAIEAGRHWMCEVSVDLPDHGGVTVQVATDGRRAAEPRVRAAYDGPDTLTFEVLHTEDGLSYFRSEQRVSVILSNVADRPVQVFPILRLNGNVLRITSDAGDRWPIEIPTSGQVRLTPRLILGRFNEGELLLQLVFLDDPLRRVTTFPVNLTLR